MDEYYQRLQDLLKQRRAKGETNQSMADQAGIKQPHINRLLNGDPEQFGKVKFETLLKLFPGFFAPCLSGRGSATMTNNNGPNSANSMFGNATVSQGPIYDSRMEAAQDAILEDDDMCEKCKTIALRHIRKPPQNKQ